MLARIEAFAALLKSDKKSYKKSDKLQFVARNDELKPYRTSK